MVSSNSQWDDITGEARCFDIATEVPPGTAAVDSKWVPGIEQILDSSIEKCKARLVAQGFFAKTRILGEISSPVVHTAVIRCILVYDAIRDLGIAVLHVPSTYLGATLHEEVYMRLPDPD